MIKSSSEVGSAGCDRWCPLSQVKVGTAVRIKELLAGPEVCQRLRELGMGEEKQVKLLLHNSSVVCQVCNVRMGLSSKLADCIVVEAVGKEEPAVEPRFR